MNKYRTTLYIGVTSDLLSRIIEHREKKYPKSFTAKYSLVDCIYHESFTSIEEAINREKELKGWKRERKNKLIKTTNPLLIDSWESDIKHW